MSSLVCFIVLLLVTYGVGNLFGPGIALMFFVMSFWPMMKYGIIADIATLIYNSHHKRNDERAKKIVESQLVIERERHKNYLKEMALKEYYKEQLRKGNGIE